MELSTEEKQFSGFKNPEEEISYLRAKLREREDEARFEDVPRPPEEVGKAMLEEYHSIPDEFVSHPAHITSEKEKNSLALALSPEAHDTKMEELYGVMHERGVKAALGVLARMHDSHLEDDFHRFLVQYLRSGAGVNDRELREESDLGHDLRMRLFQIILPPKADSDTRTYKDVCSIMEQFYAGLQGVADGRDRYGKEHFTIEIALSDKSDEFAVYMAVPVTKADLLEKHLLASFPGSRIKDVPDDFNIFVPGGSLSASYAKLKDKEVFPIKTYDKLDHDPMNAILSAFSKLSHTGEAAALQFVVHPAKDKHIDRFKSVLHEVERGENVGKALKLHGSFTDSFWTSAKDALSGTSTKKEIKDPSDNQDAAKINEKVSATIWSTNVRLIASAGASSRAGQIRTELESAFHQFSLTGSNEFEFREIKESALYDFAQDFSYRRYKDAYDTILNLKELASVFHFPYGVTSSPQLQEVRAATAPAPLEIGGSSEGITLGVNVYQGRETPVHLAPIDRLRHFYMIGQTGVGKTTLFLNMIIQDIKNGEGVCYIDPHGTDIQTILSHIPPERIDDVIYFDPAYTARPMGLNMLEYDPRYPEQKTFVVNELMSIFNKLFTKESMGPMFEQYFKNSAFLVMDDPETHGTLLEITRVLGNKAYRDSLLEKCKNPIIREFWANAERTTGEQSIANFVPYISSKFDNFISNDIMRPVVLQEKSVFNFREIMDNKKILLVNLSKGRLGEINANLIGLLLVGKIQMAALSRVDMFGQDFPPFYLYIDEFQNVTTDSISSILSEARKYKLGLNVTHQYLAQLEDNIKNAVFGNVGSMASFRISSEDAKFVESRFAPTFTADDLMKIDNYNAYVSMLVHGTPAKAFSMKTLMTPPGTSTVIDKIKELSYLKYGRPREEIEAEIMERYTKK